MQVVLAHTSIRKTKKIAQTCDEVWAIVLFISNLCLPHY
nr:hypothetical protein [Enterococcus faecalis]